jgi:hypothetical protein
MSREERRHFERSQNLTCTRRSDMGRTYIPIYAFNHNREFIIQVVCSYAWCHSLIIVSQRCCHTGHSRSKILRKLHSYNPHLYARDHEVVIIHACGHTGLSLFMHAVTLVWNASLLCCYPNDAVRQGVVGLCSSGLMLV